MPKKAENHGHARQSQVPKIEGTRPKLCKACQLWFAARPREQRCDGCVPTSQRLRRAVRAEYAVSDRGYTRTPKRPVGARKPQVSGGVNDRGALCREMAAEAAEHIDYPKGKPKPMRKSFARAVTERNVSMGRQDPRDLERYS